VNTAKRDFNKEAATWDENPARLKMAADIADAIAKDVPLTCETDALDFGCGTGLLALELLPRVRSVTGVDSAQGMLDALQAKVAKLRLGNVRTQRRDLDQGDALEGPYHLIASSMTLHHIRAVRPLIEECHRVLLPGGHLCIADLDSEDGAFHANNDGVFHFGFDRAELRRTFEEVGFVEVRDRTAAHVTKPVAGGALRTFPVFLVTGRKPA